jgi:hypothetical protein
VKTCVPTASSSPFHNSPSHTRSGIGFSAGVVASVILFRRACVPFFSPDTSLTARMSLAHAGVAHRLRDRHRRRRLLGRLRPPLQPGPRARHAPFLRQRHRRNARDGHSGGREADALYLSVCRVGQGGQGSSRRCRKERTQKRLCI